MQTEEMRLMTPSEVGDLLKLATSRVSRLAKQGRIPCIRLPDGELLFDRADIAKWLEARKGVTNA